ncbi:hypothetical protein P3T76_010340 [Phytophthora citrophthora]|uniref:RxLR effector protein n=1 Tax=Phytophthora citrophthora TaxID=4793 RepID=A0AAD9LGI2_9STRA|nr:hypothetical protein P3T76_010340 [Phytophthora citrophthora]
MNFHHLLIVSVVVLICATVSASAHIVRDTGNSFPRTLRTSSVGDSGGEERAGGARGISISNSEKLAKFFTSSKVTDDQLQTWLGKGKSAKDVFYRMKLAKSRTWIFDNPLFSKWVQYADALSDTPSGKGTSAISTLTAQYGDDDLYKMLKAAKMDSRSEKLAPTLQVEQLKHWISIGKDPDEVYKLYILNSAGDQLLREPKFSEWIKYVDDLNA